MKMTLVVQRYGVDVVGGAERLCRGVAEGLAELHDVSVEEAARCTTANARRLFKLPANSAAGESQAAQPIDPHTS